MFKPRKYNSLKHHSVFLVSVVGLTKSFRSSFLSQLKTPLIFLMLIFLSLINGIVYGNKTKNQFIFSFTKALFMDDKTPTQQRSCLQLCQWLNQWLCPQLRSMWLCQQLHSRQRSRLCLWLCLRLHSTTMPTNNFYGGLFGKKVTLSTVRIFSPYFY